MPSYTNPKTGTIFYAPEGSTTQQNFVNKGYTPIGVGTTKSGQTVTALDPAVQKYTQQGLTAQAAIGNVVMERNRSASSSPEVQMYDSVYGKDNNPSGAIDSSAQANVVASEISNNINDEKTKTEDEITKIQKPEYQQYQDYTSEIQDARDDAKTRLDKTKENIEADFAIREYEQRQSDRVQTGFASKQLARFGSYGRTGSGIDYMKSQQVRNEQNMNKLLVQKQQLLLAAEDAFAKNDWKMLTTKINESKAITDQYNQIQTWQFEDSMRTAEEITRQQKFGWEKEDRAMEKISVIASSGIPIDQLSAEEITELEQNAGLVEGTFEAIYNLAQEAQTKEDAKNDLAYNKSLWDVLSDIPNGQVVEIGGKYYTGTKEAKLTLVTDGETNTQYALRQNTDGEIEKINLGIKGKGQPSGYDEEALTKIGNTISSAYPDNNYGGQCGEFVHNIVSTYPYGLNTLEEKQAQIDPGIGMDPGQSMPQIGDVVIQTAPGSSAEEYGHVSVINNFNPDTGIMTLTESNYGAAGLVSNTRTLNVNDRNVSGFYRGNLMPGFVSGKVEDENEVYQKKFDDYVAEVVKDLAEEEIDWEEAHSRIYRQYKDDLDAGAIEAEYANGREYLDFLLDKPKFMGN